MRTDLAMENQEKFERDHVEISGVEIEKKKRKAEIQTTIVKITSEQGAKMMGKPKGTYVTIEAPLLLTADEEESRKAAEEFSHCLMEMVPEACGSVLVAGLGNRGITPDALGPETVEQLNVTRHLVRTYGKKGREVSALAPGVMAQTGMEAVEILRGTAEQTHPDVILAVDALAACSIHRLNCCRHRNLAGLGRRKPPQCLKSGDARCAGHRNRCADRCRGRNDRPRCRRRRSGIAGGVRDG